MVRLLFILQCIIDLQNLSCIDFTNAYDRGDILSGGQVLIEVPMDIKIYSGKCEFFSNLMKSFMVKLKPRTFRMKRRKMDFYIMVL